MTIGEKIRSLRISKGLSQEELGEKIGVKKAAIHKYEVGLVVNLKQSIIAALAKELDTTPSYLLGLDTEGTLSNDAKDGKEGNERAEFEKALKRLGAIRADGSLDVDRVNALAALVQASKDVVR